ncbi:uncharacterized protein VTP21DRAFT_3462 [Calcarisporiella thermophila]|uniref:uncharacterized protein n=1 Tax=Calcarisporiella thermophila TaxID=911321 RepID=UPI00374359BF
MSQPSAGLSRSNALKATATKKNRNKEKLRLPGLAPPGQGGGVPSPYVTSIGGGCAAVTDSYRTDEFAQFWTSGQNQPANVSPQSLTSGINSITTGSRVTLNSPSSSSQTSGQKSFSSASEGIEDDLCKSETKNDSCEERNQSNNDNREGLSHGEKTLRVTTTTIIHGDAKPSEFRAIRKLGEGSAGVVMLVEHLPSKTIMAKKSITADPNPELRKQVLRELSSLRNCKSPYIVSYLGAFIDDSDQTIEICTEYCEGGSLETVYKQCAKTGQVIGEEILGKIAEAVCKGIVYLHERKVIHRDIKPSNILVTRNGDIKLCDFSVSGELVNSMAQTFTGTKYYMAPERIEASPYTVQSDIWSLGVTIIEVAQNKPAFPPLPIVELLVCIVKMPAPELPSDRSEEARSFVRACLTKDPKLRPSPEALLMHPWIKASSARSVDLAKWIEGVYGWKQGPPALEEF